MKSIIIFASGRGTNTEAIIQHFHQSDIAKVQLIVCNNLQAGVVSIAEQYGIPFLIINKKTLAEPLIIEQMLQYKPDLIVLAGFLLQIPNSLLQQFPQQIINIHPSLLPKYGGKGMYGSRVSEAVLMAKERETGITIHFVNEYYDEGAHILQAHCSISADDNLETIMKKVAELERFYFAKTIEFLLTKQ